MLFVIKVGGYALGNLEIDNCIYVSVPGRDPE
jgi:hypothetical protein